jgi:hypothetical protein
MLMIVIPDDAWSTMLEEFAKDLHGVEQVCYFDGVVDAGGSVVTTVTIPNARVTQGNFSVAPEAMSQAGRHMRSFRLRRLAQIHTHPGDWVGHSPWDDEWAYSQLPGAISIVLPRYAKLRPSLAEAGVHLRTTTGWRQLTPAEVAEHLRVVPSFLDFRASVSRVEHDRIRLESPRKRTWWGFLAFWRRK